MAGSRSRRAFCTGGQLCLSSSIPRAAFRSAFRRSCASNWDRSLQRAQSAEKSVSPNDFFAELKRRNVYKVAVAYVVGGWALAQGIAQVFPVFDIPNWAVRLTVLAMIAGFPIALIIAWAFELTPEGLKRTEDVDPGAQTRTKPHMWIYVVVVGAVVSIGLFFLGRYSSGNNAASRSASEELRRDKHSQAATAPQKSIAILPFENLIEEKANAYFAEGIK